MGNCCKCQKDKSISESPLDKSDTDEENIIKGKKRENFNNNLKTEEEEKDIDYIPSSPSEKIIKSNCSSQKNIKFNMQKNSLMYINKIIQDKPDIMDAYIKTDYTNKKNKKKSELKYGNINIQFNMGIIKMEKILFKLINDLRQNPKSFIPKIEEYKKNLIQIDNFYCLIIEENKFEFKKGFEHFDECINYLKGQNGLKKYENFPSMFESQMSFKDKNVFDLYFVLIYNLMDIKSPEKNKIKRNCIMSEKYKKLNITIAKDDFFNNLYTYYFSFD